METPGANMAFGAQDDEVPVPVLVAVVCVLLAPYLIIGQNLHSINRERSTVGGGGGGGALRRMMRRHLVVAVRRDFTREQIRASAASKFLPQQRYVELVLVRRAPIALDTRRLIFEYIGTPNGTGVPQADAHARFGSLLTTSHRALVSSQNALAGFLDNCGVALCVLCIIGGGRFSNARSPAASTQTQPRLKWDHPVVAWLLAGTRAAVAGAAVA